MLVSDNHVRAIFLISLYIQLCTVSGELIVNHDFIIAQSLHH